MKIEKKSKIVALVTEWPNLTTALFGEFIISIATATESIQAGFIVFGCLIVCNAFCMAMIKSISN